MTESVTYSHGSTIQDRYTVIGILEEKQVFRLFKVEDRTEKDVKAIKVALTTELSGNVVTEARMLKGLDHPSVVKMYDSFDINKNCHLVMQYCEDRDMHQFLEGYKRGQFIPEHEIKDWTKQLLSALEYIHSKNIIHRNINSRTILMHRNKPIVADFSVACKVNNIVEKVDTFVGTAAYMSPEIINSQGYDQKTDIWSFGCVLFKLVAREAPFQGHSTFDVFSKIMIMRLPRWPRAYSGELHDIFERALSKDTTIRPTAKVLLDSEIFREQKKTQSTYSGKTDNASVTGSQVDESQVSPGGYKPYQATQSQSQSQNSGECVKKNYDFTDGEIDGVTFVVKQKVSDKECIAVACCPTSKSAAYLKGLEERGYSVGPMESDTFYLSEQKGVLVSIKGAFKFQIDGEECSEFDLKMRGYRNWTSKEGWLVAVDPNNQFGRGFITFSHSSKIPSATGEEYNKLCCLPVEVKSVPQERGNRSESASSDKSDLNDGQTRTGTASLPFWNVLVPFQNKLDADWMRIAAKLGYGEPEIHGFQKHEPDAVNVMMLDYFRREQTAPDMMSHLISVLEDTGHSDIGQVVGKRDPRAKEEMKFRKIAEHLCESATFLRDYQQNLRTLGLSDADIEDIKSRMTQMSVKEVVRQGFQLWRCRQGHKASVQALVSCLEENKHMQLAETISNEFASTTQL